MKYGENYIEWRTSIQSMSDFGDYLRKREGCFKGIVHLNIIFSYMKVDKKFNLDHPVY